jgi:hypothetical protein
LQLPLDIGGWFPVLINRKSNLQGITGIAYNDSSLQVWYKPQGEALARLTLTANNWREIGYGGYEVFLGPGQCDVVGLMTVWVLYTDALTYPGAVNVQNIPADGDWLGMIVSTYNEDTLGGILSRIYQRLATGTLQVIAPVVQEGAVVQIIRGDDYSNTDGRALEWIESEGTVSWPVLTGATVKLTIEDSEIAGSVITSTGENKKVRFELTSTNTTALTTGVHLFWVKATLAATSPNIGRIVTLRTGRVYVSDVTALVLPEE